MAELDIGQASRTNLSSAVSNFQVTSQTLDKTSGQKETYYDYPDSKNYLSYYKTIPELKKAIDALALWTVGKGIITDLRTQAILENWIGFGAENYQSIFENLIVQKKIFGDAFAEIIEDEEADIIINLKPLYTGDMSVIVDEAGMIIRYEQRRPDGEPRKLAVNKILHLVNDRVANEIHGTSVIQVCKWVIDARNEALQDERKIKHRELALGILYIDTENSTKRDKIIAQYEQAINKGEVLVLPKGTAELKDANVTHGDRLAWISYLENFFYQAVGVPRVIASSQEYSEASSKVGYLTFEPVYTREQTLFEADLLSQLEMSVKFNRPPSLGGLMQSSDAKNTSQTGFQPNDVQAGVGQ